jgi:hypothetical protein
LWLIYVMMDEEATSKKGKSLEGGEEPQKV